MRKGTGYKVRRIIPEINVHEIRNAEARCSVYRREHSGSDRAPHAVSPRRQNGNREGHGQARAIVSKVTVSGRLNEAEIARDDMFKEGNVPLQTLRANIQHATRHAKTTYGTIGVQVWIFKGIGI